MALGALSLSTTQGVRRRPFQATINGLTTGNVRIIEQSSPAFSIVNGKLRSERLPDGPVATVTIREYEPGVGAGYRDTTLDIAVATQDALLAQATGLIGGGRSLRSWLDDYTALANGEFAYRVLANDDLGAMLAASAGGGTPTPTPGNPLPALTSAYVYDRWSAQHFTPQTDNTDLSSYTSPTTGIALTQATAANRPKYRAAISPNGKPGMQCSGTQWLDAGSQPAGLVAALQRPNAVVIVVYRNLVANSGNTACPVGAPPQNGATKMFTPMIGTTENGQACVGRVPAARLGLNLSEFQVYILCTDNTSTTRGGTTPMRRARAYLNGTRIATGESGSAGTPGTGNFRWGGMGASYSPASIVMHEYIVIDMPRNFDQCDALDWTKWAFAEYGETAPWEAEPFFWVFEGNSTTAGVGAQTPGYSMPIYCAFDDNRKLGTWTNLGVSGCDMDYINYKAPHDIDRITAITGKPCLIHLNEYTNRAGVALATLIAEDKAYFAHARAVLPTAKILQSTPIALQSDTTDGTTLTSKGTRRVEYKDAILTYPLHGVEGPDAVVDIFPNPNIGAINSNPFGATYPNSGNGWVGTTEFWADSLHPFVAPDLRTPNGYSEYASIVLPAMQALEASP